MSGITQYFIGELWFGTIGSGLRIPVLRGARLTAPENLANIDPVTSNLFEVEFTSGLQYPILSIPIAVTKEWWSSNTLNTWFNLPRENAGNAPFYDVAPLSTVYFWNGVVANGAAWAISGAKVNMLSLGWSQGAFADARLELWGLNLTPYPAAALPSTVNLPTATPFASLPARSQNGSHTMAKNPTRIDIQLRNNLLINDECPSETARQAQPYSSGTYDYNSEFERPIESNASRFSVSGSFTFQAHETGMPGVGAGPIIQNETAFDINLWAPQFTAGVPDKSNKGVKITVHRPCFYNRYQMDLQAPRQMRSLGMYAKGRLDGGGPITIANWTPT